MRSFSTAFCKSMLSEYQAGSMQYTYRGVKCLKSPIDIAIYMRLLWDLKPRFILEIGTRFGGSALLLADLVKIYGFDTSIVSIDINPPADINHPAVSCLSGNIYELDNVFDQYELDGYPHPWLITEDSAHTYEACYSALHTLSAKMRPGDMLVMEDGVLDELGLSERYNGGPNRAIREFLSTESKVFEIATEYCDMFGENATYNPNGYLRKI